MKKIVGIVASLMMVLVLVLTACSNSSFTYTVDDDGIHVVAEGGADGSDNGQIVIEDGYGLCVNHIVNKGSFHVKATDESGTVLIDKDLTDNIMDTVPANGTIDVTITATDADGTVDVIAYDVAAHALADATLPEALDEVGVDSESLGLANPWTQTDTAEAAADGAGVGYFTLPEDGAILDEGGEIHWYAYQYMNLLAEADGSVGSADLVVRKGVNNPADTVAYDTEDVSGDYNEYAHSWDVVADDWTVKCFGNEEGRMMKAIWQSDNFSYSIMVSGQGDISDTYGLSEADVVALVQAIG